MKIDKAAILARDDTTTVECFFNNGGKKYTFLILKKEAQYLTSGDYVIVSTQNGLQVAQVYKVHEESRIDTDAGFKYQWAFQKVYTHRVDELEEQQRKIEEKLREYQRRSVRSQVLDKFGADEEEIKQITEVK